MKIVIEGKKAYIYTPYNSEFVMKIKRLDSAEWDSNKQAWKVNADRIPAARKIMCSVYGESDIRESKRYDVQLTFREEFQEEYDGIYFFGKCLAYAYSHRGEARVGDDVCFLEGGCTSGGSRNRRTTIIEKGSVVIVGDVPETMVQREERVDGVDYEFFERTPDKSALLEEKNSLLNRIAVIDSLLSCD